MRVLHVITRFAQGGSEQDLLHHVRWERSQGFDVDIVVGGGHPSLSIAEGIRTHHASALIARPDPGSDLWAFRQLRSLVRNVQPDLVFTHQSKAGVLGRLAARGLVRNIAHVVHMASFGPGYSRVSSKLQAAAERYCGSFTDLTVCVGNELRARYLSHRIGSPDRYAIMRTPVDIDAFSCARTISERERLSLRDSFGLPGDTPLVVAIGALEPRKRHALMLRRLAPALRHKTLTLALAGDGPERFALEKQARSDRIDGTVRFLGQTSRTVDLLGAADALVLTSRVEGVPRVVIEALAAGVPIIATEVEGLREIPDAPISVVPSNGVGLAAAVEQITRNSAPPVPLSALDEWRPSAVSAQIASIYDHFSVLRSS